ncbi:hypothetical protein OC834_006942 [Tilletia horrida]|nr:hypothetical protein OC834_006942 [Tilletia horrida]
MKRKAELTPELDSAPPVLKKTKADKDFRRRGQRSKHHGGAGASAVLRFLGVTELVKMTFEDEALDRVDLLAIAAVCKQLRAPATYPFLPPGSCSDSSSTTST